MSTSDTTEPITTSDAVARLVDACPTFQTEWERFDAAHRDDPGGAPLYLAMANLARHLVLLLEEDRTASFATIFATVETLLADGTTETRSLVGVGLIEDLSNNNLYTSVQREAMYGHLGPLARRTWDHADAFAGGASMRIVDWVLLGVVGAIVVALLVWIL